MNNIVVPTNKRKTGNRILTYCDPGDSPAYWVESWRKRKKRKKRPQSPTTPYIVWLRERIFVKTWGEGKVVDGEYHVHPKRNQEELNCKYRKRDEFRGKKQWRRSHSYEAHDLPNYKIDAHLRSETKLYYFGSAFGKALICHDHDVQKALKIGTSRGAEIFAERINSFFPAAIHVEKSNRGQGRAGYWTLQFGLWSEKALEELQRHDDLLKRLLVAEEHDLENIEIKGLPPEHDLDPEMTGAQCIAWGEFAKIPMQASVMNTCEISLEQLTAIDDEIEKVVLEKEKCKTEKQENRFAQIKRNGSGRAWRNDKELHEAYENGKAYATARGTEIKTTGRWKVIPEDEGLKNAVLKMQKHKPNKDGTFPIRQAEGLWKLAQEIVGSGRCFNHHRWAAMRNYVSARGGNNWTENKYTPCGGLGGACKYSAKQDYLDHVNDVGEYVLRGGCFMDTQSQKHFGGQNLRPVNRLNIVLDPDLDLWEEMSMMKAA